MHSATKWIGGHGVAIGGLVVEDQTQWEQNGHSQPWNLCPFWRNQWYQEFVTWAFVMRARSEGMRTGGHP